MAKTQILDYYIHLTDKAQVDRYNDQLAAPSTVTNSPDGVGSPLLFIPATGKHAILRAPFHPTEGGAAVEFAAPLQEETTTFAAPCTRSPWFLPGTNNFPRDAATFTRKSGGWFGIPALFGSSTKFYWAGHFVYAPPAENADLEDGSGVPITTPGPLATRLWIHGFELPVFGEGLSQQVGAAAFTPDAARIADGGFGFAYREQNALKQYVRHQIPVMSPKHHATFERFYLRVRRLPSATTEIWMAENGSQSSSGFNIRLMPNGQLAFYSSPTGDLTGDLVSTGGQLTVGTWARIDIYVGFGGGNAAVGCAFLEVRLNGAIVGTATMTPAGIPENMRHSDSYLGRRQDVASTIEVDFDDWVGAKIPPANDPTWPLWDAMTTYAIGDHVRLTPGCVVPSALGFIFKAKTVNLNKLPTQNPADWSTLQKETINSVHGSHVVIIRPTGDAADRANWNGNWRKLLQRPPGGFDGEALIQGFTAGAILSVTTDAADLHRLPGVRGIAGFVFGMFAAKNLSAAQGTFGHTLNGGAAVMIPTALDQLNGVWNAQAFFPAGLVEPLAVTSLELRFVHGGDALEMRAISMHAVAEAIGVFGPEDVPAGTVDVPPFPILRTGQHNRWYPRSPWAQNTSRGHAPVVLHTGTYVGASDFKDLFFRVPPHLVFIRRVTGASDSWAQWWASMLASHKNFEVGLVPGWIPHAGVDPTFVPLGGEDDQAQRYVVRITGNGLGVNAVGATYQYFAICDPAARFLLTGAFSRDNGGALPVTELLSDPDFTADAAFFQAEDRAPTSTAQMSFKSVVGHAADAGTRLPGNELANFATFGAGQITVRAGLLNAGFEQIAYALFRRDDGNLDLNRFKVLSLLTWVGDGAASRTVPSGQTTGLRPLWALATSGTSTYVRDPAHTATNSTDRANGSHATNGITAGAVDSITVGSQLNANGTVHKAIVFWGGATACNNGWSCDGEFIPVEPDSPKPPGWGEPIEVPIDFTPPPPPPGIGPGIGDGPVLDMPDLDDDLADALCIVPTVAIANLALSRIGSNAEMIQLATADSAEATAIRRHYDLSLQATLKDRPWPFATRYASLTLLAGSIGTPANPDWTFAYRLPDNCLQARRLAVTRNAAIDPTPPPFREGQGVLFTNETSPRLEYTARVHCPSRVSDPTFLNAWAWRLAHEIAPALTRIPEKSAEAWAHYQTALAQSDTFNKLGAPGPRPAAPVNDPDAACPAVKLQAVNVGLMRIGAKTIASLTTEQSREAVSANLAYEDELQAVLRDHAWSFARRYTDPAILVRGPAWTDATVQAWVSTQSYVKGDTVTDLGVVYSARVANTGSQPPSVNWSTTPTTEANNDWTYAYRMPTGKLRFLRVERRGQGRRALDMDPPAFELSADATGELVMTDERDAILVYITRPNCALSIGDALFRDAFSWRLAAVLAPSLAAVDPETTEQVATPADPKMARRSESGALRLQQLREQRGKYAWAMYQQTLNIAAAANSNEQQQDDKGDADWIRDRT